MSGIFRHNRYPTKTAHSPFFRWTYWRQYTASEAAYSRIAEDGTAMDRLVIENVYKKRKQVGLWWWATLPTKVHTKSTVRHHYARTLRNAFIAALNERGFQKDGTRDEGFTCSPLRLEDLQGSLQMLGNARVMDVKLADLRRECLNVVDQIIKFQSKGAGRSNQHSDLSRRTGRDTRGPQKRRVSAVG